MKSLQWLAFLALLCPVLLTGCASLEHQFDRALFGSDENIRIAKDEIKERQKDIAFQDSRDLEKKPYRYISEARLKGYLEAYPRNDEMMAYARARAGEIAELYGPVRPNGQRFDTIKDDMTGVKPYWITSELRAYTYSFSARSILNEWMRKDKNREVILRYGAHHYAVGVYHDGTKYYCVFLMGSG